eukprot:scaffold121420_cov28-Tisochrysis_lutea.AAC.4
MVRPIWSELVACGHWPRVEAEPLAFRQRVHCQSSVSSILAFCLASQLSQKRQRTLPLHVCTPAGDPRGEAREVELTMQAMFRMSSSESTGLARALISAASSLDACAMGGASGRRKVSEQRVARGVRVRPALERNRVSSRGNELETLSHQRLGEHARGGGAIPRFLVALRGNLDNQLGADIVLHVLELDVARDGHAVVDHFWHAKGALKDYVAPLRADGHLQTARWRT